ncbi:MAG TPA: TPM domain-containing protein [Thermoanaerobaculia bacterium]|nr:TPM domain-containing protein [Thermoanaerobaculia bacterium]
MRPIRFVAAALLLAIAPALLALEVPPPPKQWFTDNAGIVDPAAASGLNQKLQDFEQQSGAQFIIYVFRSIENEAIEDFTIRCVERWKVGQKKYDNGLVLFVFFEEKKVRIEVGYGLEGTVTDAFSSRVIREHIAPYFQRQDYAGGLTAAANAIMTKIRTGEEPVPPMQRRGGSQAQERDDLNPFVVLAILFVIFFVVAPMLARRRGGCSGCIFPLFLPGGGGVTFGGGGFSSGGFGGGGGFSGGGGGFGGGGATGGW